MRSNQIGHERRLTTLTTEISGCLCVSGVTHGGMAVGVFRFALKPLWEGTIPPVWIRYKSPREIYIQCFAKSETEGTQWKS